jgi:[ribosomal protein S5]-alanine N-acetyltransferase
MAQLETDRLLLREFVPEDWEAVHRYASDSEVSRFMDWEPFRDGAETRAFLAKKLIAQKARPRRDYQFAVLLKQDNRLIGSCSVAFSHIPSREAELGYNYERAAWGQGYATEAALAVVAFSFREVDQHRIWATCDPANVGSMRVLEKIGMQREGYLREHRWMKSRWRDSLLYAILVQDWRGDTSI